MTFNLACEQIQRVLHSRPAILEGLLRTDDPAQCLPRLRSCMRSHSFAADQEKLNLQPVIAELDQQARASGFNVLHDWDGTAEHFNPEIIPVDLLDFLMRVREPDASQGQALHILLDYHLFYLLGLLSLRVWDEGDANERVDRVNQLLADLQGPEGSGQAFVENWASLVLLATSHFEGEDSAYDQLLAQIRGLHQAHRLDAALVYAGVLACHLRFGLQAVYDRDLSKLRGDNVPDYPLLSFALSTLMARYAELGTAGPERDRIAEGILNALTADAGAFLEEPPPSLANCEEERMGCVEIFRGQRTDLLADFERLRPGADGYSPLCFYFNFPHNLLKGSVLDALLRGRPWARSLNDLLRGVDSGDDESPMDLAKTLMGYARAQPDPYRGRLVPSIVYDPGAGLRDWERAMAVIGRI